MPVLSLIIGALAGLAVTMLVTVLWPRDRFRWLRPFAAAGLGFLVAFLVITLA